MPEIFLNWRTNFGTARSVQSKGNDDSPKISRSSSTNILFNYKYNIKLTILPSGSIDGDGVLIAYPYSCIVKVLKKKKVVLSKISCFVQKSP